MNQRELAEVLSVHADGLKDGVDMTPELSAAVWSEPAKALEGLLTLARRVKVALVPVEPRSDFAAGLKAQLRERARQARTKAASTVKNERKLLWVAAGLGSMIYLASLALISLRTAAAVLSLMAAIAGWRAARSTLPKRRTAA